MSRSAVEQLTYMLNQGFDGDDEHSLLANIREVTRGDWSWLPPGGRRPISEIFVHAAAAKHVYAEHLFGEARLSMLDYVRQNPLRNDPDDIAAAIAWAREGHARFIAGMGTLEDASLAEPSRTHWGAVTDRRFVIGVMIQHDVYHAGEINHIRALRQGNDAWWPESAESEGAASS